MCGLLDRVLWKSVYGPDAKAPRRGPNAAYEDLRRGLEGVGADPDG